MKVNDIIICECHSVEHQIIFNYDDEHKDWAEVYVTYHLDTQPFWYRLKYGIKYIFGYQSKYGGWGELILNPEKDTINKFEKVVKYLKKIESKK